MSSSFPAAIYLRRDFDWPKSLMKYWKYLCKSMEVLKSFRSVVVGMSNDDFVPRRVSLVVEDLTLLEEVTGLKKIDELEFQLNETGDAFELNPLKHDA